MFFSFILLSLAQHLNYKKTIANNYRKQFLFMNFFTLYKILFYPEKLFFSKNKDFSLNFFPHSQKPIYKDIFSNYTRLTSHKGISYKKPFNP